MKKLALIIAVLALMLLSAGCGQNAVDKDDMSKEVKLVWYCIGSNNSEDFSKVMTEVNKYLKEKINATVDFRVVPMGDYEKKLKTTMLAGEQVDICFTSGWCFDYRIGARQGFFYPLNDLLNTAEGKKLLDVSPMMKQYLECAAVDGKEYAIPVVSYGGYQKGYFVNKTVFDKVGADLKAIRKIEDFYPYFDKIKASQPGVTCIDGYGYIDDLEVYDYVTDPTFPGAVRLDDKDCKVLNQYLEPEYIAFQTKTWEMQKRGYMYKDVTGNSYMKDFRANKLGVFVDSFNSMSEANWNRVVPQAPCVVIPAQPQGVIKTSTSISGAMAAIGNTSKNPERAFKFLELLYTDAKLRNMLMYGLENVHYKKVKDNVIEKLPDGKKYSLEGWTFGNGFLAYSILGEPENKLELAREFGKNSIVSPLLGFNPDLTPVQNEVTALTNVNDKYKDSIRRGMLNPKEFFPKFVEELNAAGLQKYLDEMQKQIDNWKKTKK